MSKKLYVGNLPFSTNEDEIRDLFAAYGEVQSVNLIVDRETGRLCGFGFVEMAEDGASAAMEALDGKAFGGRDLLVNEAQERQRRPSFDGPRRNNW